jgi:threonine/homoserine/homoserine lactone efflux protein
VTYSDSLSYFFALIAIALAPGPVALVMLVRSASRDIAGALGFGLGFSVGGVVVIAAVCFGLATWLSSFPAVFEYTPYVMLTYLLWLAYRIWTGEFDMTTSGNVKRRSFLSSVGAGVLTCFISPYMMILFPLVLPGILDIKTLEMPQFLYIATLTFLALAAGSILIIVFAAQLGRLSRSAGGARRMNRLLAGILAIAGCWMAFS